MVTVYFGLWSSACFLSSKRDTSARKLLLGRKIFNVFVDLCHIHANNFFHHFAIFEEHGIRNSLDTKFSRELLTLVNVD